MASQVGLFFLLVALATIALAAAYPTEHRVLFGLGLAGGDQGILDGFDREMMIRSDSERRQLGQAGHISYGALGRDRVPCSQRGQSYYNCRTHEKANPYARGCTRATNCARSTR